MSERRLPNPIVHVGTIQGYRQHFMDRRIWEPYVRAVCLRHGERTPTDIRPGLAGTYPTFIVDDRWVVKFFGHLFDGQHSFETERTFYRWLRTDASIRAPSLIAEGQLFSEDESWHWPYLILEYVPGISVGEVYAQLSWENRCALARTMAEFTRQLHALPITGESVLAPGWDAYLRFLHARRAACAHNHRAWKSLPESLIAQIDRYLLSAEALVDFHHSPHPIHADLTQDHVLGHLDGNRWVTSAIIDFGDGMRADLTYELVALHLDLFQRDKRLLRVYLEHYGVEEASLRSLPKRAMCMTLLHRFNVLEGIPNAAVADLSALEDIERLLWDITVPDAI